MLIDYSVQNYSSFNSKQEFSMLSSTATQELNDLSGVHNVGKFGIDGVLQSVAIFGANGSGKTNFVASLAVFKNLVLESVSERSPTRVLPFLLKEDIFDAPSEFEVSFVAEGNLYRYGLSLVDDEISEEWLYWSKSSRETMLFHREKQSVKYNQRSFAEAKLFVRKDGDNLVVEKTKSHIPFVSVLAQFDGEKSSVVTRWFEKLNIISGIREGKFKKFTIEMFEEEGEFKSWALKILEAMQILDVEVVEQERKFPELKPAIENDKDVDQAVSTLRSYFDRQVSKEKTLKIIKKTSSGDNVSLPLDFESEGTCKLIYLLGPLYDVIKNDEILIIDEFDNKFHTLLSRFIVDLYNSNNFGKSQLILTCHDTNLLSNKLFRRDQIWFVDKNESHESVMYSLVEYKDHYVRREKSYSSDYLLGKYGAIPLFSSVSEMGALLDE